MSFKKTYAVLGLGRYGEAVARELNDNGAEVIAVDRNVDTVDNAGVYLPTCKCADVTDPEVIKQLGIGTVDTVIISMASNLESTVMAIMLCKEAGVPNVIVKCANEVHQKIYSKVGADRVIFPEYESGKRLAKGILSSGFTDMLDLSGDISMVEIPVKPEWNGKSLIELNLRQKYSMNVVGIKQGEEVTTDIDPTAVKVARENIEQSGVSNVTCDVSDLLKGVDLAGGKYNVVAANIVADIIIRMMPDIAKYMADDATLIASGIICPRREEVEASIAENGFEVFDELVENDWCALAVRKKK